MFRKILAATLSFLLTCSSVLQNADFRLKRAKELDLKEQQNVLIPIIRSAKKRLVHSSI